MQTFSKFQFLNFFSKFSIYFQLKFSKFFQNLNFSIYFFQTFRFANFFKLNFPKFSKFLFFNWFQNSNFSNIFFNFNFYNFSITQFFQKSDFPNLFSNYSKRCLKKIQSYRINFFSQLRSFFLNFNFANLYQNFNS